MQTRSPGRSSAAPRVPSLASVHFLCTLCAASALLRLRGEITYDTTHAPSSTRHTSLNYFRDRREFRPVLYRNSY